MIEEQTKTVTEEAYEKCREGNGYLVVPVAVMAIPFTGMSDMADGLGGYHSLQTLKETLRVYAPLGKKPFRWGETKLTDDLVFVHYCFDEDDEKQDTTQAFDTMGLVDIRQGRKVKDITLEDLVSDGFIICSPREIKKLQGLNNEIKHTQANSN